MTASGVRKSITNPLASQDLPGATTISGVKTHQDVLLRVLPVLECKSMVWSMLAFTFPQAQAKEAEIHLSPALVITNVTQEKTI